MKTKINAQKFFEDKKFGKEVKLTQVEAKLLSDFEDNAYYSSGLSGLSGGFASLMLDEYDEEFDHIILGYVKSGVQDGDEDRVYTDRVIFNRETKTIVFD